ncbi:MAG: response regulator [Bacteroidia bacterium]|nr:response regulator [Bacteroidia bacterium]MDW8157567.1 response regulator [Bacteroidia bacterium]
MEKKLAILFVDDEKIVLDSLLDQFMMAFGERFHYEFAESVEEAWEVIDYLIEDGYEMVLVISDWLMPGIKGDTFLIDLHKRYPQTIKFLLTGQAEPQAVKNAMDNANLYAYIQKPWNQEALIATVNEALKEYIQ